MSEDNLGDLLHQQFMPAATSELDVRVTFQWDNNAFDFAIREQQLVLSVNPQPNHELIIYTSDKPTLLALLRGQLNPLDAFMSGDLRSNGYLMWVFRVLAAFPPKT